MAGLREAIKGTSVPPNLRRGNARRRCGLCRHFDGKGGCRKYQYPVRPNQLSDSFSAATSRAKEAA